MSDVIAYTHDGDHYCEGCIEDPDDEEVGAVFRWDEITMTIVCGGCGEVLYEYEAPFPKTTFTERFDSGRVFGERVYEVGRVPKEIEERFTPPNSGMRLITFFDEDDGLLASVHAEFD